MSIKRNNKIAVTGIGMVTPLGLDRENSFSKLREGKSAIVPLRDELKQGLSVCVGASVDVSFDAGISREWGFAKKAVDEALLCANTKEIDAIVFACGAGLPDLKTGIPQSPLGDTCAKVARHLNNPQIVMSPSTACAAGLQAVLDGCRLIQSGVATRVLVGGADSRLSPIGLLSYSVLGALTNEENPYMASRPFDKNRNGFVVGEGACAMVLESEESAKKRTAPVHGFIHAGASTCDAYRATDPDPSGKSLAKAMLNALKKTSYKASDIGYYNAHGTSTIANDAAEALALNCVFKNGIPVSSFKSMFGHLAAAAGIVECALTIQCCASKSIFPSAQTIDVDADIDVVSKEIREMNPPVAMCASCGFGGQNTVVIVSA